MQWFFIIRNSSLSVCHLLALRGIYSSFGHKSLSSKEIKSGEQNIVLGILTAHLLLSDVILENDILSGDESLSHFGDCASWYRQRFSSHSMKKKVKKWKDMNASRYSGGRIYYRYVGEHGRGRGIWESPERTGPDWAVPCRGAEWREGDQLQQSGGPKERWGNHMAELNKEKCSPVPGLESLG